jgi:hypothetical protein
MRTTALLLTLPALGFALPGMMGVGSRAEALEMLDKMRREAEAEAGAEPAPAEKRGLLDPLTDLGETLESLVNDIAGEVGSIAESVDPDNFRPEPGYHFIPPGPNDSRGPCPGLNLLANYGYLPRDGYVNFGQVVEATS